MLEAWCFPGQTYARNSATAGERCDAFGGLLPVSATPLDSLTLGWSRLCRAPSSLFHPSRHHFLRDAFLGSSQWFKTPSPLHSDCTLSWTQIHCALILFPVFCPQGTMSAPWKATLSSPSLALLRTAKGEAQNRGSVKKLWVGWSCSIWGSSGILKTKCMKHF